MDAIQESVEIYVEDEGTSLILSCVHEASRALGVSYTMRDLLMTHNCLLELCVRGAWMKRVGQN